MSDFNRSGLIAVFFFLVFTLLREKGTLFGLNVSYFFLGMGILLIAYVVRIYLKTKKRTDLTFILLMSILVILELSNVL